MSNIVLTEYQSACRAAHEQVQLLQDLYEQLSGTTGAADVHLDERLAELRDFLAILSRELERQDLLPTQPDPEKEEVLEIFTEFKERFTPENHSAIKERLASEEKELLSLGEKLLTNDHPALLDDCLARSRDAVRRLMPPQ
jgi:hypothetical protein